MQKILLKILVVLHIILSIIWIIGLFLIFYKPFQIFFVYFFIIVVWSEIVFLWKCPLTIIEDKLSLKIKLKKNEGFFINRILSKYLKFEFPQKIVISTLLGYFILSVYILFN